MLNNEKPGILLIEVSRPQHTMDQVSNDKIELFLSKHILSQIFASRFYTIAFIDF